MPTFQEVIEAIQEEREYQKRRWPHAAPKQVAQYITYIADYLHDAQHTVSRTAARLNLASIPLRKVIGLGFACMEDNGLVSRSGAFVAPDPNEFTFETVAHMIAIERDYQDNTWGSRHYPLSAEITMLRRYLYKLDVEWCDNKGDQFALVMLPKFTAIAVRALENNGFWTRQVEAKFKSAYHHDHAYVPEVIPVTEYVRYTERYLAGDPLSLID